MLTPHCSAASGIVVPPSIVSTTRLRKSAEYGFAIHAGLLPAGSLNHIRAAMGIPDSAFPGNALNGGYLLYKVYFEELNRLGYIEGQNLIVERYSALGQPDRIGDLARQIAASHPDVILPVSGVFIKEIMTLTTSIPMVGPTADPVSDGFSSSLARPDRNFTGVVLDSGLEIWAKRVQLLLEAARKVTKLGYLLANPIKVTPSPR